MVVGTVTIANLCDLECDIGHVDGRLGHPGRYIGMCGRFVQRYTWDDIQELYDLPDGPARNLPTHYNIAPSDPVEVMRPAANDAAELVSMRWGLIPWWWKKPLKQMPASFNARAETVADKPMFRDAFQRHRCVIPASGYYEWLKAPDGRQPYFISAADGSVLSFAGLWDRWKNPETGEPVISCTIIVTFACGSVFTVGKWRSSEIPLLNKIRMVSLLQPKNPYCSGPALPERRCGFDSALSMRHTIFQS